MHIREFMTTKVNVCVPKSNCASAGQIMRRHRLGFLSVVDSVKTRGVIGVVTDRDILLRLVRLDRPASKVTVNTCMRAVPTMMSADADLSSAVDVMKREALYWLPVTDQGRLVGMLSLEDVALAARRQWAYVGSHINEQHVTEILEAIAVARGGSNGRHSALSGLSTAVADPLVR